MKFFVLFCICLISLIELITPIKRMLHPSINVCKRNDPNVIQCSLENLKRLLPYMQQGIPEMNIQPLDPFHVDKLHFDFTRGATIKLVVDLNDVKISGLTNAIVDDMTFTIANNIDLNLNLIMPSIFITADYKATGKFFLLSIDTQGNYTGEFHDVFSKTHWTTEPYLKNGKVHLKWSNEFKELSMKSINVIFSNIFEKNEELTKSINAVINESAQDLYAEVSPIIEATINAIMVQSINNLYAWFPFEELYPEN